MTLAGLLTFFGLAVVTMDVLGGVIAATFLARGMRPLHLLYFLGGYAVAVLAVTLVLKPILAFAGRWVAPVLDSGVRVSVIQLVVGCALIGFAAYQCRSALRPRPPKDHHTIDQVGSLAVGGLLLSLTTFADPTFTIAVGLAMQTHSLLEEIVLLVAWNVIYQLPLVTVTVLSQFGLHTRVLRALERFFGPRRRVLLLIFSTLLCTAGLVVIADGIIALTTTHHSWLQSLLLLRSEHGA
jgi:cytochrome c biogenesis protein CcdA